jgi:hypothetical protein
VGAPCPVPLWPPESAERGRDREAERLGRLEVDDQLELGRLLDGEIAGLGAFQNLVHVGRGAPKQIGAVRSIGHEAPDLDEFPERVHRGDRCFAAGSTRRRRSGKNRLAGNTTRALARGLVIFEQALSKSSDPRASTTWSRAFSVRPAASTSLRISRAVRKSRGGSPTVSLKNRFPLPRYGVSARVSPVSGASVPRGQQTCIARTPAPVARPALTLQPGGLHPRYHA